MRQLANKLLIGTTLILALNSCSKKENNQLKQIDGYNYVKVGVVSPLVWNLSQDYYDLTGDKIEDGFKINYLGNVIVLKSNSSYAQEEGILAKVENNPSNRIIGMKFFENENGPPDLIFKYLNGELILYRISKS